MTDKRTALFDIHKGMGARLVSFHGWSMPVEYSGITREHTAVRTTAGLFDVSHMGELEITGPEALQLIQLVTSNDASRLADGQAQYSALVTPEGTFVDDLLVYRYARDRYMLVVNAGNTDGDLNWIRSQNRFEAEVLDQSDATGLLALQGPRAEQILQPLTESRLNLVQPYHFIKGSIAGVPTTISRTGYTGEDGFEIYFPAPASELLWNTLFHAGQSAGILPAGLGARNTLRLEARLLLYGNDIDRTTTLLEAGLGWIVKMDKGEFIGRDALAAEKARGVARRLTGFAMLGRDIARDHYSVVVNGVETGRVTSGSPSITLKRNIGLTYLPPTAATPGTRIQIQIRGRDCDADVVTTPFYRRRES